MTDREMLELAAQAAGLRVVDRRGPVTLYIASEVQLWEALTAAAKSPVPQASGQQSDLRRLIADDSYVMQFQSMGQYRSALLKSQKGGGN